MTYFTEQEERELDAWEEYFKGHPFWHFCQACWSPLKVFILAGLLNIFWEFVSFMPTHEFFHWMGWLD